MKSLKIIYAQKNKRFQSIEKLMTYSLLTICVCYVLAYVLLFQIAEAIGRSPGYAIAARPIYIIPNCPKMP